MMPGMPEDFDPQAVATVALNEALEEALGAEGAAAVEKIVVIGNPAQSLLERSKGANLLVVGARGYSGFKATLLGSVSLHVTQHAELPGHRRPRLSEHADGRASGTPDARPAVSRQP